jgi:hypothetical protein
MLTLINVQNRASIFIFITLLIIGTITGALLLYSGSIKTPDSGINQETPTSTVSTKNDLQGTSTVVPIRTTNPTISPTETRLPTGTPNPTPSRTSISTPTPILTASPTPEFPPLEPYQVFIASFLNQMELKSDVPIEFRGYRIGRNKTIKSIYNFTDETRNPGRRLKEQNGIINAYSQTLLLYNQGKLSGKSPRGLRIYEINASGHTPKTVYVDNSTAAEYASGQIDVVEFHQRVYNTDRNMTDNEKELARNIARASKNGTIRSDKKDK